MLAFIHAALSLGNSTSPKRILSTLFGPRRLASSKATFPGSLAPTIGLHLLMEEAGVSQQHVHLVQHDSLAPVQFEVPLLEQRGQPPGGAHDHVSHLSQLLALSALLVPACHRRKAE